MLVGALNGKTTNRKTSRFCMYLSHVQLSIASRQLNYYVNSNMCFVLFLQYEIPRRSCLKMTAWRLQLLCPSLVIIFVIVNSPTGYVQQGKRISIAGNVTLGALFAIHFLSVNGSCSRSNSLRAIQEIEAMLYAVDKINADDKLLPNIKLGVKAFDTCGDRTSALNSAVKEFVLGNKWDSTDQCREPERPVIGVVGPAYSNEAVHITPFMNLFEIPLVSYSATSAKLSNKDEYKYFSRTVTSDDFQIPAIIDLLVYFNWTYVSVLYSDEAYGIAGYEGLKEKAQEKGRNYFYHLILPADLKE